MQKWGGLFRLFSAIRQFSERSGAENLAATTTTGGQNTAAILGGHTGTEAMHLAALTLLGLVSTEHYNTTPLTNFMYGVAYFISTQNTTKQLH